MHLARTHAAIAAVAAGERGGAATLAAALAQIDPDTALARSGRDGWTTLEVLTLAAEACVWVEQWDRAASLIDRVLGWLRERAAVSLLSYPLTVRGWLDFRLGRWEAAHAHLSESIQLALDTDQRAPAAFAFGVRSVVLAARGEDDGCRSDAGRATAGDAGSSMMPMFPRGALGLLALGRGDVDAAIAELAQAQESRRRGGNLEPGADPFVYDLIEAHVRAQRRGEAQELLEPNRACASAAGRALARAAADRCAGLLADDEAFETSFGAALELHQSTESPFEQARTLLCLGERRRRARRLTEARDPLRQSLEIFDTLGAAPWSRRARTELRATGGAVPAAAPSMFAELTAHEVQVAQLVAEGRTNREIAAALFIAPKTVEHHLSRIFRKLGVRRRAELARLSADLQPGRVSR